MEEHALRLWGGDDFLISETVERTWITVTEEIHKIDGDVRNWLHATLQKQFMEDSGRTHLIQLHTGDQVNKNCCGDRAEYNLVEYVTDGGVITSYAVEMERERI